MVFTSSKTIGSEPGRFPDLNATHDGSNAGDSLPVSIGIAAGLLWLALTLA